MERRRIIPSAVSHRASLCPIHHHSITTSTEGPRTVRNLPSVRSGPLPWSFGVPQRNPRQRPQHVEWEYRVPPRCWFAREIRRARQSHRQSQSRRQRKRVKSRAYSHHGCVGGLCGARSCGAAPSASHTLLFRCPMAAIKDLNSSGANGAVALSLLNDRMRVIDPGFDIKKTGYGRYVAGADDVERLLFPRSRSHLRCRHASTARAAFRTS